jgi:hypothetical protein
MMSPYDLPDDSLVNLANRATADAEAYHGCAARTIRSFWEIDLGAIFDEMARNRSATEKALDNPDPLVRRAAVWLIGTHWPANAGVTPALVRTAFHDPESLVRGGAVYALWRFYSPPDDATGWLGDLLQRIRRPTRSHAEDHKSVMYTLPDVLKHKREAFWRDLAGPRLSEMFASRSAAEAFLDDREPRLRRAAINIVCDYWRPDESFVRCCEESARSDPDFEAREAALRCVTSFYRGSKDARIARFCAEVACDESLPRDLRNAAYANLIRVMGPDPMRSIKIQLPGFRFPEEVDWSFVRSFLS